MLGGNTQMIQSLQEAQQANSPEDTGGQAAQPAGGSAESTSEQAATESTAGGGQEDTGSSGSGGGLSEEAAAQAVKDHYTAAADGDYDKTWNFLSSRYQQQFGSQEYYTSQFGTLQSIEFAEGPTAQVSGNTATVTGETIAKHTDRTERNRGTWTLVNEGGQWKISNIDVQRIS
jgi:serine/threonine-protein kinase